MRKGQYTLLEQVILFALGISITIGFLFAFNNLKSTVKEDVKETQAELVSEYIASSAIELVASGAEGRIEIAVPDSIASETYAVRLGEGGVRVQMVGQREVAPLYGLGSRLTATGVVDSSQDALSITFVGNQLDLERAE